MSDTPLARSHTVNSPDQLRYILGIRVNVLTGPAAIDEIDERVAARRPSRVAFLNANLANMTVENETLRDAISSFFVLNDGIGVDIASVMLYGRKFPDNKVGTDFIPRYLTESRHDLRVALIGGSERVLAKAIEVIWQRWPRHDIVYSHHGYFDETQEAAIAEAMARARADIVLVAMGNPRQEVWMLRNIPQACAVGAGVGALFDYLAGAVPRAPVFILRWRLEWVYRLWAEPARLWRRYLVGNFVFMARILREWSRRKLLRRPLRDSA
jgi:exopolysaccharide biosynthesis WecB/TagA/CpsF family protein